MKRLVFIDSGVLIAASQGKEDVAKKAFVIFNDPDIDFASSNFVQLETLPKPTYLKKDDEVKFYEEFFSKVSAWAQISHTLAQSAMEEAIKNGLGAVDALHIAAAIQCRADEFVTAEKPEKPLFRVSDIPVRSIRTP